MRFLGTTLLVVAALFAITACSSKSSSNSSDQSNAAATSGAEATNAAATTAAAGDIPDYPGATTQASGSSNQMGAAASGKVESTDDSFDKVYGWYQQHLPAGSEKTHTTVPMPNAVFTVGASSQGQTSVTITTAGGKTVITIGQVKM
jgi:hypothetical protein